MTARTPYPGPLKVGDSGPAVRALQLALQAWGAHRKKQHPHELLIREGGATGSFGRPTALQCGHVQKVNGLDVTNTFGGGVHHILAPYYPARAIWLLLDVEWERKLAAFYREVRRNCAGAAGLRLNRSARPSWHYSMTFNRNDLEGRADIATAEGVWGDCSSTGGIIVKRSATLVGLPDPGYGEWFNTKSLIGIGQHVAIADATIGDRVHYGAENSHLGVVMGMVQGVLAVYSFGGEPGPLPRPLTYREIYGIRRDYPRVRPQ